jgi:hypothetical protein
LLAVVEELGHEEVLDLVWDGSLPKLVFNIEPSGSM